MKPPRSSLTQSVQLGLVGAAGFFSLLMLMLVISAWIIPPEIIQNWLVDPHMEDVYALYEQLGMFEAGHWLARWVAPVLVLASYGIWQRRSDIASWLEGACRRLWQLTAGPPTERVSFLHRVTPWVKRGAFIASFVLAIGHWRAAFQERLRDWPVYRLHDGDQILPNISQSNRDVIQYLRATTPENARIYVVSDQKLFFLSYYLRPRSLYHRIHPEAEHLIPRAHQSRQLAAYTLAEVPADAWSCRPDFVLEYFEGQEYIDPARAMEDPQWLQAVRQRAGDPEKIPEYTVVLRRWPLPQVQP